MVRGTGASTPAGGSVVGMLRDNLGRLAAAACTLAVFSAPQLPLLVAPPPDGLVVFVVPPTEELRAAVVLPPPEREPEPEPELEPEPPVEAEPAAAPEVIAAPEPGPVPPLEPPTPEAEIPVVAVVAEVAEEHRDLLPGATELLQPDLRRRALEAMRKSMARPKARCTTDHSHVIQRDGEAYIVERALVEYYTQNLERFMSLGWSRRYNEDGVKGWYVSGFGCNSHVFHAGFRRGDVIQSVNGIKTKNLLQVYRVYTKMKRVDAFEVRLLRKGRPVVLTYTLV